MTVLIIDDEPVIREVLRAVLGKAGYATLEAATAGEGLAFLASHGVDLVLLDLMLPDRPGLEVLAEIRARSPEVPVVVVTAYSSVESAIAAMRDGAYHYVPKPFRNEEILHVVREALEKRRLVSENRALRAQLEEADGFAGLVGRSPAMERVFETVRQAAPARSTVLIVGESGTGKELVAKALHKLSARRSGPFVTVHSGSLPSDLLESNLFGHLRGSFTGAVADKKGLFKVADGGTIFFDEIGTVPVETQAKLLRVLQEREITPVGGNATVRVDVRILAATNRDLRALIAAGRFREDLFYRLSVVVVPVPPLRERREEIPALARALVERLVRRKGFQPRTLGEAAVSRLVEEAWPGNVRELENALERALVLARGPEIGPEDLPLPRRGAEAPSAGADRDDLSLSGLEAQHVRKVLEMTGWRVGRAAALLGIDRKTLSRKVREYGLRERGRNAPGGGESPPPSGRDARPPRDAGR